MNLRSCCCTVALLVAAGLAGCTSVQMDSVGDTVAVYQFGEFKMLLNTTAPKTAEATKRALQQMDLYQTSATVNRYDARINARARNDQRISIIITEVNRDQTLVRIRWGEGGNLNLSRRLFETIETSVK